MRKQKLSGKRTNTNKQATTAKTTVLKLKGKTTDLSTTRPKITIKKKKTKPALGRKAVAAATPAVRQRRRSRSMSILPSTMDRVKANRHEGETLDDVINRAMDALTGR